jgi:carboxypeptidase C (cathepsin A)
LGAAFNASFTSLGSWFVRNETAGYFKTVGKMSFVTVLEASHMAPYDKPVEVLSLVSL